MKKYPVYPNLLSIISICSFLLMIGTVRARAQTLPDTTALLKKAGVDPTQLQAYRESAPQMRSVNVTTPAPVHELSFASKDNTLELSVQNATGNVLKSVTVEVKQAPNWLTFSDKRLVVPVVDKKTETNVIFQFDVNGQAPVGHAGQVVIQAIGSTGKIWEKTMQVKVAAPDHFKLLPNYPNPFNPSTNIHYQLPATMRVTIRIYDILGREVATLSDGQQQTAGSHLVRWDAHNLASGVYFYRVIAERKDGSRVIRNRKMLLIK